MNTEFKERDFVIIDDYNNYYDTVYGVIESLHNYASGDTLADLDLYSQKVVAKINVKFDEGASDVLLPIYNPKIKIRLMTPVEKAYYSVLKLSGQPTAIRRMPH